MKRFDSNMVKRLAERFSVIMLAVAVTFGSALMSSCSDNGGTTNSGGGGSVHNFTQGVVKPSNELISRNAMSANLTFTITTENGYTIDVDNSAMMTITSGEKAEKGGTHKISFALTENTGNKTRTCNVFIQVDGYQRMKLFEIRQETNNASDVVAWMDERLQTEYYWLDEYNEKRGTFDFSLEYEDFLSASLLSLSTNIDDGGVYEDGERYIFSYIDRWEATRSVFSESRKVHGFGLELASTVWTLDDARTQVGLAVTHVYPGSAAAEAGILRGDVISKVNGKALLVANWGDVNNQWLNLQIGTGSVKVTIQGGDDELGNPIETEFELQSSDYENNPVAFADVLEIDETLNPNARKVGYLVYRSFIDIFTGDLVDAIKTLSEKGATDVILDLRENTGGVANLSNVLTSMLIDQSYEGKLFAKYIFNPKNKIYSNNPERSVPLASTYTDPQTGAQKTLPHMGLKKVWIIVDNLSASSSESVIVGLQGLDIDVELIGETTRGKNCGMSLSWEVFDGYEYEFAPITFMHANAKGFSDYGDGIKADVDIPSYASHPSLSSDIQDLCRVFPMPITDWGNYKQDLPLAEAVYRICSGKSLLDSNYSNEAALFDFGSLTTRAGGKGTLRKLDRELRNPNPSLRQCGMYIIDEELTNN